MPFLADIEEFRFHYLKSNRRLIQTLTDIIYIHPTTGELFWVPAPVLCDGQTIPSFLWPVIGHPLEGRSIRAAVMHDYGYRTGTWTKAVIDDAFKTACCEEGVNWVEARLKWRAVQLAGWIAWWKHRRREKKEKEADALS